MNLRLPLPPLSSNDGQGEQLSRYLRQLVEQLNWAMEQLDAPMPSPSVTQTPDIGAKAAETFEAVKGLIIKSSEIAQAYSRQTLELLHQSGEYVSVGELGSYREALEHRLEADLTGIRQDFSRVETVTGQMYNGLRTQNSYLRFGQVGTSLATDGETAPGIEIGDFLTLDGAGQVQVRQRFARFTAYGLELFGSDKLTPVAWISDRQLHIASAQVEQLRMGHFVTAVRPDGSTVKRWLKEE